LVRFILLLIYLLF